MFRQKALQLFSCGSGSKDMGYESRTGFQKENEHPHYKFYKHMVKCAHQRANDSIYLEIVNVKLKNGRSETYFDFHDGKHQFALLSVNVSEKGNKLYMDTLPF